MQCIHTYVPETNHVARAHSVAAIPRVLLMVHIALSAILNSSVLLLLLLLLYDVFISYRLPSRATPVESSLRHLLSSLRPPVISPHSLQVTS
jgi:hypothetical protein